MLTRLIQTVLDESQITLTKDRFIIFFGINHGKKYICSMRHIYQEQHYSGIINLSNCLLHPIIQQL